MLKNNFGRDFLKLMNNVVFGKTMEIVRNHRDITLIARQARKNYLASKSNYHTSLFFFFFFFPLKIFINHKN